MLGLALEDMNQVTDSDERYFFSLGFVFFFLYEPETTKLSSKQSNYRSVIF